MRPRHTLLRRLRADTGGASALEFAIIAPALILCFLGLVETGQVLVAGRRTDHAAAALADLLAQRSSVATSDIDDSFAAAGAIMRPMDSTALKLKVTSITVGADKKPRADWSRGKNLVPDTVNAVYAGAPAGLLVDPGDTVVVGQAQFTLVQASSFVIANNFGVTKTSWVHPRNGKVVCTNC